MDEAEFARSYNYCYLPVFSIVKQKNSLWYRFIFLLLVSSCYLQCLFLCVFIEKTNLFLSQ